MILSITFSYPPWFILLCLLLGGIYAFVLYFRDQTFKESSELMQRFRYLMGFFRFLTVSFIALLLLTPFLKSKFTKTVKPIIVIAQDNSESIKTTLTYDDSLLFVNNLKTLENSLSEKYDVFSYSFGDELEENFSFNFKQKVTNLSAALNAIDNLYYNQNLGAVILATDGIYNQGNNPVYSINKGTYPIYPIALGDTNAQKDVKLGKVYYNKIAYLDDRFALRVDISAQNFKDRSTSLNVYHILPGKGSKKLHTKSIAITNNLFESSADFVITADKIGIQHYRLVLSPLDEEITTVNNTQDIFIDVLDSRQKILLIAAAPHPDISAIRQTLEKNKNYELEIDFLNERRKSIDAFNLIILHQIPSKGNIAAGLMEEIKKKNVSVLFICGTNSNLTELNKQQSAVQIQKRSENYNEVTPSYSRDFSLFKLNDQTVQAISKMPPLFAPFANFETAAGAHLMLSQKIGAVVTDYPLLVFSDVLSRKTGVLLGEGIWRWRLYDYLNNGNHNAFEEMINKTIQYLAVKSDKRKFRTLVDKNIFFENEKIKFEAQLYNENYELVNSPDVNMIITDEEGKDYPFQFSKTTNAYVLNTGYLPVSNYTYKASTSFSGNQFSSLGEFSVSPLQLEALQTQADHQLLYLLGEKTGGKLFYPKDLNTLAEEISQKENIKPVLYDTYKTQSVINFKWLFFALLLLISLEWFLRKYFGGY